MCHALLQATLNACLRHTNFLSWLSAGNILWLHVTYHGSLIVFVIMCVYAGELTGHGLSASHSAHQLGGPLGSALSMGANAPVQSSADFLKETMHEVSCTSP